MFWSSKYCREPMRDIWTWILLTELLPCRFSARSLFSTNMASKNIECLRGALRKLSWLFMWKGNKCPRVESNFFGGLVSRRCQSVSAVDITLEYHLRPSVQNIVISRLNIFENATNYSAFSRLPNKIRACCLIAGTTMSKIRTCGRVVWLYLFSIWDLKSVTVWR